jgi:TPR repeat protein
MGVREPFKWQIALERRSTLITGVLLDDVLNVVIVLLPNRGAFTIIPTHSQEMSAFSAAGIQGHAKAQFNLAWAHLHGRGAAHDAARGVELLRLAAEAGVMQAPRPHPRATDTEACMRPTARTR